VRTIGIVTTSRADYGIYLPILHKLRSHPYLDMLLYVSGTHLVEEHGNSINLIEEAGFPIAARIPLRLENDSPAGIVAIMGQAMIGFANAFKSDRPDILLILGDRYEMHAAAVAAVPFGIPIAHIHGGELTYGAIDDAFRHSLTKLSHLHFASTEIYARRIIQMGEEPWRVTVSGAPSLDNLSRIERLSRKELEGEFSVDLSRPFILATMHPVTKEFERTSEYISEFLEALDTFDDFNIVFTHSNSDTYGSMINKRISEFAEGRSNVRIVKNFGQRGYLSMMAEASVMVGNSSSGIIEAASFGLPVVNVGTRQEGRIKGANIIDTGYQASDIQAGIQKAISLGFRKSFQDMMNPYGDGNASERIVSVILSADLDRITTKRFYDLTF
jgi:UDP-N-acetylglucosamine 2-epimerase (non-hydrolysing)/GDP/UDP-N,N'-diacetylbacillosamine 2-epimerase (hydrolysing)